MFFQCNVFNFVIFKQVGNIVEIFFLYYFNMKISGDDLILYNESKIIIYLFDYNCFKK